MEGADYYCISSYMHLHSMREDNGTQSILQLLERVSSRDSSEDVHVRGRSVS